MPSLATRRKSSRGGRLACHAPWGPSPYWEPTPQGANAPRSWSWSGCPSPYPSLPAPGAAGCWLAAASSCWHGGIKASSSGEGEMLTRRQLPCRSAGLPREEAGHRARGGRSSGSPSALLIILGDSSFCFSFCWGSFGLCSSLCTFCVLSCCVCSFCLCAPWPTGPIRPPIAARTVRSDRRPLSQSRDSIADRSSDRRSQPRLCDPIADRCPDC